MNFWDITFLLILIVFMALGFFQGLIRLTIALIAFYISIILASLYFPFVGLWISRTMNTTLDVGRTLGYLFVLVVACILLTIAGLYTFRYAELPGKLEFLGRILGTFIGLLLSVFVAGVVAQIVGLLFLRNDLARLTEAPVVGWLQSQARSAQLMGFLTGTILQFIYATLDPILPDQVAVIFQGFR